MMRAHNVLPAFTTPERPIPPVGIPLSAISSARAKLLKFLPPTVIKVLDGLWAQIENQIFEPLLRAESEEKLVTTFGRLYHRFTLHYVSAALTSLAAVEEDPERFIVVTALGFQEAENLLRERGPKWIGREATVAALVGFNTMALVAQAAPRFLVQPTRVPEDLAKEWAATTMAYMLAALAVVYALTNEKVARGRWANAAQLAYWSKGYAAKVYDLSKRLNLLKAPYPPGPLPEESDDEDLLLAEAALKGYRELLAKEEKDA